jgi:putative oxidoreductase
MKTARAGSIVAWTLQVPLALLIAGGGAAKLSGDLAMVDLFEQIGAGQWLRYLVGVLEVLGGVGLLVPRVRALAALGLFVLLLSATVINLTVLHASPLASLILATLAGAITVLRRRELGTHPFPPAPDQYSAVHSPQ